MWLKPERPAIQYHHPLAAGLRLALPFSEGSGEPRDLAFGTQAVRTAGVTWSRGPRGSALDFDGGSNLLVTPHPSLDMTGRDFSLSCAIYREIPSTSGYDTIWYRAAALAAQKVYILISDAGVLHRWDTFDSGYTIEYRRHYHIAYTFSAATDTSGTEAFYVDGAKVAQRTGSIPASSSATIRVGAAYGNHPFHGVIDAPMMWIGRCLTAADARMLALDPFAVVRPSSSRRLLRMGSVAAPPIVPGIATPGPAMVVASVPDPTATGATVRSPLHTPRNNVYAALAAAHPTGTGTLTMAAGQGVRFGDPTEDEPIRVTVARPTAFGPNGHVDPDALTIYSVTGRSGDTLTGCTPIEGTPDRDYAPGDHAAMWMTAGALEDVHEMLRAFQAAPPGELPPHQHAATDIIDFDAAAGAVADQSVADHEAKPDPHPAYLKQAEADALYLTSSAADAAFLTQAEADALFLTPAEGGAAYQPLNPDLTAIGGLAKADGNVIVGDGSTWVAEAGNVARTSLGLGTADSPTFSAMTTTGIVKATQVQIGSNLLPIRQHASAAFQVEVAVGLVGSVAGFGTTASSTAAITAVSPSATGNAIICRGAASQTAPIQVWQANNGVVLAKVDGQNGAIGCRDALAGAADASGGDMLIQGGIGNGTGIGGGVRLRVSPPSGSPGTAPNALVDGLTITGAGSIVLARAALVTTATSGFTYLPSCAGPPTGVPGAQTGTVPIVIDATNNVPYIYNAGWKASPTLAGNNIWAGTNQFGDVGVGVAPSVGIKLYVRDTEAATSGSNERTMFVLSDVNPPSNSTAIFNAAHVQSSISGSTTANISTSTAMNSVVQHSGPGTLTDAIAVSASVNVTNATVAAGVGLASNAYGVKSVILHSGSGIVSYIYGYYSEVSATGTGTIAEAYGFLAQIPTGTGPIATNFGVRVQNQGRAGVSTSYGIYVSAQSGSSAVSWALRTMGGPVKFEAGDVVLSGAALATTATSGFTYLPTCPGPPAGVPGAQAGTVPIVVDTINNVPYFYNAGWQQIGGGGGGGGSPGGSAAEIQYRSGSSTFGAVANVSRSANGNLILAPQSTPGSLVDGELFQGTQKAVGANVGGIPQQFVGCLFSQAADVTISNTAIESSMIGSGVGSATLPADFLVVGKTIRVRAEGLFTTPSSGSPSLTIRFKLGSTTIMVSGAAPMSNNLTGRRWGADMTLTCRLSGASGTVIGQGFAMITTTSTSTLNMEIKAAAPVMVNTTGPMSVDLTFQMSGAVPGASYTCTNLTIEALN